MLCRQVRRLVLGPADRALLAVLSRSPARQRGSLLLSEDLIEAVHQAVRLRPAGVDEDVQQSVQGCEKLGLLQDAAMVGKVAFDDAHDGVNRQRLVLISPGMPADRDDLLKRRQDEFGLGG